VFSSYFFLTRLVKTKSHGIATDICNNLTSGAYSDWFLPNSVELFAMYTNLHSNEYGSFLEGAYWASDQKHADMAGVVLFVTNGYSFFYNKFITCRVRAARKPVIKKSKSL
jgi:hypothetical protein